MQQMDVSLFNFATTSHPHAHCMCLLAWLLFLGDLVTLECLCGERGQTSQHHGGFWVYDDLAA